MTEPGHAIFDERRFAPAVREHHNGSRGPTAQYQRLVEHHAEQDRLIRLLWAEGWTAAEIGEYLGCGVRAVRELVVTLPGAA